MNFPLKPYFTPLLLTLSITISACHQPKAAGNEIKRVDFATGGCFGPCQLTAISANDSLQYHFYGGGTSMPLPKGEHHNLEGYYAAKASRPLWDSLCLKLNQIHFQQLDSAYNNSVDDQSLELIVYYGENKIKHVKAQSASLPDKVRDVFYWIAGTYKKVRLQPSNHTAVFKTTLQRNSLEPPPVPDSLPKP